MTKYKLNPILNADSYKLSHFRFYPEGTTNVYSYMESRGGRYPETLFFGAQGLIKEYLQTPVRRGDISYARDFAAQHGFPDEMFNTKGWNEIVNKHGGYMPVEIKAVPEGAIVPNKNILMSVENTGGPNTAFSPSYIETMALRLWYPITVATRSLKIKREMIKPYFDATSDTGDMTFACLDFSARGCSSMESNLLGGAAHLINFAGSDSMAAIDYVKQFYGGKVLAYSVPATEHSIMCSYEESHEFESFSRIIDIAPRGSIVSVVSDTWNIFRAAQMWVLLKDKIIAKNITLVVRPDSGTISEVLNVILATLAEGFGGIVNKKGYLVINNVKVLWADGMNEDTIATPFQAAMLLDISADSIMTGSGGGYMQVDLDRDTNKFAFKASNIRINGVDLPIAKNPITDPGKVSKKGRMKLQRTLIEIERGGKHKYAYNTVQDNEYDYEKVEDYLRPIFRNGELLVEDSMETIRERVNQV